MNVCAFLARRQSLSTRAFSRTQLVFVHVVFSRCLLYWFALSVRKVPAMENNYVVFLLTKVLIFHVPFCSSLHGRAVLKIMRSTDSGECSSHCITQAPKKPQTLEGVEFGGILEAEVEGGAFSVDLLSTMEIDRHRRLWVESERSQPRSNCWAPFGRRPL